MCVCVCIVFIPVVIYDIERCILLYEEFAVIYSIAQINLLHGFESNTKLNIYYIGIDLVIHFTNRNGSSC